MQSIYDLAFNYKNGNLPQSEIDKYNYQSNINTDIPARALEDLYGCIGDESSGEFYIKDCFKGSLASGNALSDLLLLYLGFDSYSSREDDKLPLPIDENIRNIKNKDEYDFMLMDEVVDDAGNYSYITRSGFHRMTYLKVAYLYERSLCKTEEEIRALDEKYKFKGKVRRINKNMDIQNIMYLFTRLDFNVYLHKEEKKDETYYLRQVDYSKWGASKKYYSEPIKTFNDLISVLTELIIEKYLPLCSPSSSISRNQQIYNLFEQDVFRVLDITTYFKNRKNMPAYLEYYKYSSGNFTERMLRIFRLSLGAKENSSGRHR